MGWATYFFVNEAERAHLINRELPITGETVYSDVQADLSRIVHAAQSMAANEFLIDWVVNGEKKEELIVRYLKSVAEKNRLQESFLVSAQSGKVYSSADQAGIGHEPNFWLSMHRDAISSFRVHQKLETSESRQRGGDSLILSYRLSDNYGADVGVVGVSVSLNDVYNTIDRFTSQHDYKVILVDTSGRVVKVSLNGRSVTEAGNLKEGDLVPLEDLIERNRSVTSIIRFGSSQGNGNYANLRFVPDIQWYLLITKESDESAGIALRIAIAGAVVFCIVLILSWTHQEVCLHHRMGYLNAKSQSLAAMSHDLKHLIQAHNGLVCICCEGGGREVAINKLSQLKALSNEIYVLGEKFLSFYRLDLGICRPNFAATNLSVILRQLREEAMPLTLDKGGRILISVPDRSWGYTDRVLLKLILRNFISNAIKYAGDGVIKIDVDQRSKQMLRIRVRDNGPGLDREAAKSAFNAFVRGANTDGVNGDGLGLYLAAYYATRLKCKLGFDESYKDGACFWLDIPRASRAQISGAVAASNSASTLLHRLATPLTNVRILLISGQSRVFEMIRDWGADVTACSSVEDAHVYLEQMDLFILDLRNEILLKESIAHGWLPKQMPAVCIVSETTASTANEALAMSPNLQFHAWPIKPARLKQQLIHLATAIRSNNQSAGVEQRTTSQREKGSAGGTIA